MKFVVRKQYFSRPSEKIPNVSFISKFTCTILDEVSLRKLFFESKRACLLDHRALLFSSIEKSLVEAQNHGYYVN